MRLYGKYTQPLSAVTDGCYFPSHPNYWTKFYVNRYEHAGNMCNVMFTVRAYWARAVAEFP